MLKNKTQEIFLPSNFKYKYRINFQINAIENQRPVWEQESGHGENIIYSTYDSNKGINRWIIAAERPLSEEKLSEGHAFAVSDEVDSAACPYYSDETRNGSNKIVKIIDIKIY